MTSCYVTTLPRKFMRGVADFDPGYPGAYYLPRDAVTPPPSLQRMIWPWVDGWTARHEAAWAASQGAGRGGAGDQVQLDVAAPAVLELLRKLRIVLLQASMFYYHGLITDYD